MEKKESPPELETCDWCGGQYNAGPYDEDVLKALDAFADKVWGMETDSRKHESIGHVVDPHLCGDCLPLLVGLGNRRLMGEEAGE